MKNRFLKILSTILVAFLFITNVNASKIAEAGENITQEGEYNSVRFIAGNNVTNKATIDGISFVAGNTVNLNGNVTYGFYAGNVVNINERVEKDLFAAGNNIIINKEAVLGRDVFIAGNSVVISSDIERDLRVGCSYIIINDVNIKGDVYIDAEKIMLNAGTVIGGKLSYPENATIINIDKASIGSIEAREVPVDEIETEKVLTTFAITSFITWLVAAVVTLLILLSVVPSLREKLDKVKLEVNECLKSFAFGLLILVVVPIVCLFTIFTGILTPLSLIVLALYFICIYLASLFGAYVVGRELTKLMFKKGKFFLNVFFGILVVRLVSLIPVLGGLVEFVVFAYGLGLIYQFIILNIKKK